MKSPQPHPCAGGAPRPARWVSPARPATAALIALSGIALLAAPARAATRASSVPRAAGAPSAPRTPQLRAESKTVSFSGHYKGNASLLIDNGSVTISSVSGTGRGTLVGASSVAGSGTASAAAQCDPFSGTGSISGGTTSIRFKVSSSAAQGCSNGESGPITVTFHGVAKAVGGTGKAVGANGSLKFSGTLNLGGTSGSQTGSFTVKLTGKLSVK